MLLGKMMNMRRFSTSQWKAANIKTAPACKVPRVYNKKLEKQKLPFGPLPSNQKCLKKVPSGFSQVCPGYPFIQAVPGVPPPVSLGGNVGSCSRRKSSSNFT